VRTGVANGLTAPETTARARGLVELILRLDRLENDTAVGVSNEALRTATQFASVPTMLVAKHERDYLDVIFHAPGLLRIP
jgi:hypothetical protein